MKPIALALATGILLALSLPPFNVEWLGWIAVAPLLVTARGRTPLETVGLALVSGLLAGLITVRWHPNWEALHSAYVPYFWLAFLLAAVAVAANAARKRWDGLPWIAFVSVSGVATEWASHALPLPMNLALSQHRTLPVLHLASVTGIWGVSLLLWWTGATAADALLRAKFRTRETAIGALALAGVFAFGLFAPRPAGHRLTVAAIQDFAWGDLEGIGPEASGIDPPDREALTRQAVARGAKIAVWTERCLGGSFRPEDSRDETTALARELKAPLVVGYMEQTVGRKSFNCAGLVDAGGRLVGVHRKLHPFMDEVKTVEPGHEATAFETPLCRIGMLICFDTCYTGGARSEVAAGARLIAVPTIDPPVVNAVLHELHSAMAPFRAAENGVGMIRADPGGLSQIVDPDGRIVAQSPMWSADALVAEVGLGDGRGTLFTRFGDWLAYLCAAATLLGLAMLWRPRPKPKDAPEPMIE